MYLKKIILIMFLSFSTLLAHKVAGVDTTIKRISDNKIHIKAFFKKSNRPIFGNKVRLISMFDNRVLNKGKLNRDGLILNIPKESYWVYVLYKDNDIVKDGPSPKNGFTKAIKKERIAFLYSFLLSIFFLILSIIIAYKKSKMFQKQFK